MNKHFVSFALATALVPTAAFAQSAPPPMPPPDAMGAPTAQQRADMEQMRTQMMQLHERARAQMLGALSPQHRTYIQNLIGQLATAAAPNPQAAAQQIDTTLSPGEKQSILNIHSSLRTSSQSLMEAQRARFEATLTPQQRAQMQARHPQRAGSQGSRPTPDAGTILLRTLGASGGWGMGPGMHDGMH